MQKPIALTDHQMNLVKERAQHLRRFQRPAYLEEVAVQLQGKVIGDGEVFRAVHRAAQKVEAQNWAQKAPAEVLDGTGHDLPMASAK
jgi:hypothetical protein